MAALRQQSSISTVCTPCVVSEPCLEGRPLVQASGTYCAIAAPNQENVTDNCEKDHTDEVSVDSFPDGGYGWVCVLSSFIYHFFAIGIESTWGVYQRYFLDSSSVLPKASNSQLAWVGSIQATGVPVAGMFAGIIINRIGYRLTLFTGSCVMGLGFILASFSTQVWHLYLTQGLIFGLGSGLGHIPAVSDSYEGLATGIGVSGSGIGALVLSPLTQVMIDPLGFRWALRITGILSFIAMAIAGFLMRTRQTSVQASRPDLGLTKWLLKDIIFLFLCSVGFFGGFGFYIPSFYVPDYATNHLALSPTDGAASVALISGLSAIGRVLFGVFGDKFGHLNALAICQGMGAVAQMGVWPFTRNRAGLMGFCALFGFFPGASLIFYRYPVAAEIHGVNNIASVTGALFSGYIPGTLVGPVIAGVLLDKHTTNGYINFLPAQLYGGGCMAAAATMAILVKIIHAHELRSRRVHLA
ncbi:hypothetical protein PLICRDRAFT_106032 [Plicaturopsis crispa FD-325 SS-3]|nr:hypothetical protein PLICRDRAFT_106032 [Plicaturopsis crispa FD-325 SS-3]